MTFEPKTSQPPNDPLHSANCAMSKQTTEKEGWEVSAAVAVAVDAAVVVVAGVAAAASAWPSSSA